MSFGGDGLSFLTDRTTLSALSSILTAFATIALVYCTWVLARETKILSRATSQAHVTATLEPNPWAINSFDIVVANSGNAVAYDISIEFEPPLKVSKNLRRDQSGSFHSVSILRPGQVLQSYLASYSEISQNYYSVKVSWTVTPNNSKRQILSYTLSMPEYEGLNVLGARNPAVHIADQMEKIQKNLHTVLQGQRRIKVDTFSEQDRAKEARERDEWIERARREATDNDPSGAN